MFIGTWEIGDTRDDIPIMDEDQEDRVSYNHIYSLGLQNYLLVYTTLSIKRKVYYLLLDLATQQVK